MISLWQIGLSALFSGLIAWLAQKRGSLSRSGAWGALFVGTAIFGFGGWRWGVLLTLFFVSSTALSHFKEGEKAAVAEEKFAKGHARDFGQVMANGGLGSLIAIASVIAPSELWLVGFIGVMATANADTWGTELGTLAKRPPRLITNGRVVPAGTSGGVTGFGTAVSFAGGLLIGLGAGLLFPTTIGLLGSIMIGGLSGLAGSLYDSFLGATVQGMYYADDAEIETEKRVHQGKQTRLIRGWRWMTNDVVNLIASGLGGGTAVFIASFPG